MQGLSGELLGRPQDTLQRWEASVCFPLSCFVVEDYK